jgi:hypothetical protein
MSAKVFAAAAAVLSVLVVAGCGGHSLPNTKANLDVCRIYVKVRTHQAPLIDLTGATLESNAPISHQLRQDLANYIALTFQNMTGAAQAASKADADCSSIGV